jgi:hypothetical protein
MFTIRQYAFLYGVLMGSLFAGASLVHAVLQPDLTLPPIGPDGKPLPKGAASTAAAAASAATADAGDDSNGAPGAAGLPAASPPALR